MVGQRIAPADTEVRRLWPDKRFRLFLSHVSKHKLAVSKLKDELELFGISAFVAHEAIKPNLEWLREIELALRSRHALLALVTPDFHASVWTDQEIGWAFGRGVLVVPVRLGVDPYGFAGKAQGISGVLEKPKRWQKQSSRHCSPIRIRMAKCVAHSWRHNVALVHTPIPSCCEITSQKSPILPMRKKL